MRICEECTEHKMIYDSISSVEECECYCHVERENGCVSDPCCR